jgi:hypothetical protein
MLFTRSHLRAQAFDVVKKQLFGRLHDIARAQIFPDGVRAAGTYPPQLPPPPAQAALLPPPPPTPTIISTTSTSSPAHDASSRNGAATQTIDV